MLEIPDAPWIQEAERTGHYRYGWWNTRPGDYPDDDEEQEDENVEDDAS